MTEERLEKIETKLAFQDDLVSELNKTIYYQQQMLERLEATCEALVQHLASLTQSVNEINPMDERPPHY